MEDVVIEELVKFLVCVVNTKLLKRIVLCVRGEGGLNCSHKKRSKTYFEVLKAKDIKNSNEAR